MKVIGFTTKYYTLWDVTTVVKQDKYGKYRVTTNSYIKNISFDRDKAMAAYPGVEVDESLRGHSSWESFETLERYAVDEFNGGKYRGMKISECQDISYLYWCYDSHNCIPFESRKIAEEVLINNGYKLISEDCMISPAEVERREKMFEQLEEHMAQIDRDGKMDVVIPGNPGEDGAVQINDSLVVRFPNVREMSYQGWPYYLPIDAKGACKRVKGKSLTIVPASYKTEEYWGGIRLVVEIETFNINK